MRSGAANSLLASSSFPGTHRAAQVPLPTVTMTVTLYKTHSTRHCNTPRTDKVCNKHTRWQQTHPTAANTPDILGFFPQKSPLLLQRKPIHPSIYSFHECSPVDTYIRMFILAHVHSRTCPVLRILCTFVRTRKHLHIHTHAHTRSIY